MNHIKITSQKIKGAHNYCSYPDVNMLSNKNIIDPRNRNIPKPQLTHSMIDM